MVCLKKTGLYTNLACLGNTVRLTLAHIFFYVQLVFDSFLSLQKNILWAKSLFSLLCGHIVSSTEGFWKTLAGGLFLWSSFGIFVYAQLRLARWHPGMPRPHFYQHISRSIPRYVGQNRNACEREHWHLSACLIVIPKLCFKNVL